MVRPRVRKLGGEEDKLTKQSKLTDFHTRDQTDKATEDMAEKGASSRVEMTEEGTSAVLAAIISMRTEFSAKFDGIISAIESIRKEMNECTERMSQAEQRISSAEDDVASVQSKVRALESKCKTLEDHVLDLEARSRRNNLRLVGLPEGVEGRDPCSFLENWIPQTLNNIELQSPAVLERAHRIGPLRNNIAPPRTLIMKFLNYKDKMAVISAARAKGVIKYQGQQVRFYPDLAAGIQQQRKQFDLVRKELRTLGIRHGIMHPARLVLTHEGRTHIFKTPQEAQDFIRDIQKETGGI